MKDKEGNVKGVIETAINITEKIKAQKDVSEKVHNLEIFNKAAMTWINSPLDMA